MTDHTAFDALAHTYDDDFTASPIARFLRQRVQDRLMTHFRAGQHVLELGCGTGEDAVLLAQRGIRVTATDASPVMLEAARAKTVDLPYPPVLTALDLDRLPDDDLRGPFAGVYANFGVLNCLTTWRPLAAWLADRIAPGGTAAFSIMSLACAWEPIWCALHGDFTTAFRRWRPYSRFAPPGAPPLYIRYPSIARLTADFAPHFRRTHVEGMGVFLPPSAMYPLVERRPALLRGLLALEAGIGRTPALAALADHYWIEFTRTDG